MTVSPTPPEIGMTEHQVEWTADGTGYVLKEAIVGQGGERAILMLEEATGIAVETFVNGYDQPNAETWAEARGFLRGWVAAEKSEALVREICA